MEAIMKHVTIMAFVLLPFLGCDTEKPKFEVEEKTKSEQTVDSIGDLAWSLRNNNLDSMLILANLELKLAEEIGYQHGISDALNIIGVAYRKKGNLDKALNSYFKTLKIREKMLEEDPGNLALKGEVSKVLNNIGLIYVNQQDYSKALEYLRKDQEITNAILSEKPDSAVKSGLSVTLSNIGMVLARQGKREEALKSYREALNIAREAENKDQLSLCFNNIADLYRDNKDFPKALAYYQKSIGINREIGNKLGLSRNLMNLGRLYKDMKMPKKALDYLKEALTKNVGAADLLRIIYDNLTEVNIQLGNTKEALLYHDLHTAMKDSINKKESSRNIAEMETKYETEKKEKQIEIQNLQLSRQQIGLFAFAGGLTLVLIIAFVIFKNYRQKKKANLLLERKNVQISFQKKVIEEKSKDITDSIRCASDIQKAIVPPEKKIYSALPQCFVLWKPKDIVSGDFPWFTETDEEILIAACDCTGHGVPGAFMHMKINELLNQAVIEKNLTNPSEIFFDVRAGIIQSFNQDDKRGMQKDGMDAALLCFHKDNNTLSFALANNPLFLIRDGELQETKPDKQPVGFHEGEQNPFTNHEIELQKDDIIYIFSDGYVDQFGGPMDKKFMIKRLRKLLVSIHRKPMKEQKEVLDMTIENWMNESKKEQTDDILVIGVRVQKVQINADKTIHN